MNQTKLEISVGAFVVVGFAAIAYLALKIGAGLLVGTDTYLVQARFSNAAGLNTGSRVSISGVTVGSVESVQLDPNSYAAVVAMRVRADVRLPTDTTVSVRSNGLLGDKFVRLRPGTAPDVVSAGGELTRTEATTDLESAIAQFTGAGAAPSLSEESYLVRARFWNVGGLSPGARVAIAGVSVGVVENIRLNLEDFSAIAEMRIRGDVKLPLDSMVSVRSSGLIGGKFLAVSLGADEEVVAEGDLLTETESSVDLESLISRFAFGSVKQGEEANAETPAPAPAAP